VASWDVPEGGWGRVWRGDVAVVRLWAVSVICAREDRAVVNIHFNGRF
jgi:hypothetical protein